MITFEVEGLNALTNKLKGLPVGIAKEVRKAMNESALRVKADAISSLRRRSIGKTVLRRGIKVLVSKPGDAPNSDTGKLLESVMVSPVKGNMFKGYSVEIKAVTPYAEILEDKKRHNRPFMQPALDKNKPKIRKLIIKAVTKSI